jgi:DHA1 family inner membrane transport protein
MQWKGTVALTVQDICAPRAEPASQLGVALTVLALSCGAFGIGVGEFAVMALLPEMAASFRASVPDAGYMIMAYAAGVVIGAPLIAVAATRLTRRTLLLILMTVFALGNLASAAAPSLGMLIALRFLTGLPHGAYFGVAALVAASLAPPNRRTQMVGYMMLGLTVATLIGTPAMALFGEVVSWRVMFLADGLIGALTFALITKYLPQDGRPKVTGVMRELVAFKRPQVLLTLALVASGFGGMFSIFSYIAATATDYAKLSVGYVPLIMVLFGLGMNVGNLVGSRLADRSLMGTIGGMMVFNIVTMTAFGLFAQAPVALSILTFLLGTGFAAAPAIQTRLMDVAREGQTLAAATMHSAFNIANALGAWLGGRAIAEGFGYGATGYVGAVLSLIGLCVFAVSYLLETRGRAAVRAF